ncbi:MAG: hypothetical protein Unbinned4466contig1000_40 [Prokaryotic dsDNA virus sp.]|nr:MAG: hypothetical protein Unbinned4466contig1000_40 [Prokaryotic dsDNA virus sp.]|tara:strand:+ start:13506 stop:13796 length:291 start_codon:yes stop_codon:yes gene_type:complete
MEDYKQAALTIFPTDWFETDTIHGAFKFDNNAAKRAVAEEVFKAVFDKLKTEHVADSVAKAFLRRASKWGAYNNGINAANMSTALMAAIIAIRDDE